jgi:hypothetical protein
LIECGEPLVKARAKAFEVFLNQERAIDLNLFEFAKSRVAIVKSSVIVRHILTIS